MELDLSSVAVLIGTIGSTLGLNAVIPKLWRKMRGQERRDDLKKAWEERDTQARRRRRIEEHAHELRRMLIEAPCIKPSEIPSWPSRGTNNKETPDE